MEIQQTEKQVETAKKSKAWRPYVITFFIGAVMALGVLVVDNAFSTDLSTLDRIRFLSDAFFVPGALILCVGIMIFVSSKGSLDALTYSLQFLQRELFLRKKMETFADYKVRKAEKKTPYRFLLLVGLVYFLLGLLFTLIYLQIEGKAVG